MKRHPKPPTPEFFSVNALSKLTGRDRKTLDKAIAGCQLKPGRTVKGHPQYRLADVQAALAAKPDKTLKDDKLSEEIRKLRIANDEREGKLIRRTVVNQTLQDSIGPIAQMLTQRLENEFPALVQGLDTAGCRVKGKQLNDAIRADLTRLVEEWPE